MATQPIEIACRFCAAQPHEPCHATDWTWDNNTSAYVQKALDAPHGERVFDAAMWEVPVKPDPAAVIEAIERSDEI